MSDNILDEEKLSLILEGLPFTLNEGQMSFIRGFISGTGNWCLVAAAGAGKSLMMSVLAKYYGNSMVFTSTTGVSSENMPDSISSGTTHGVLSLPTQPSTEYDHKKVNSKCSKLFASSDTVEIVCVDECFCLNSDNLDMIRRRKSRFDKATNKRDKRDIRFLFVGDCLQATTITDFKLEKELAKRHGHHLMYMSSVWDEFDFTYAMLHRVERQSDKVFKEALDVIRYYDTERLPKCLNWLNKRCNLTPPDNAILLAATNKTVSAINNKFLNENPNPKQVYKSFQDGKIDRKEITVGDSFTACVGLRVLTINNDSPEYGERWKNGSAGWIVGLYATGVEVLFDNGVQQLVDYHTWENKERTIKKDVVQPDGTLKDEIIETKLGEFKALPLIIGHGITFSRVQGSTITAPVIIDPENEGLYTSPQLGTFGTNAIYVGLSRATSLGLVYLKRPLTINHIKPCKYSLAFWDYCKEESVI